ncbi:MmgE/PrpD family protein [Paraburkholderia xenovorans]|uniref:MmgE/PrpD family protein n=1 Tax=Paraburkholderia xenovorans TaxID=36873 RepID=UPI00155924D9|nr:MmgE/PrpD family protein [Paraburkholderia xenovorans]NPT37415.1 MmgE/PrpD family protein [Paraburkholderia xenovorans]
MSQNDPDLSRTSPPGLTHVLVERALGVSFDALPEDVRRIGRDCLVDWLACSFAAIDEPASRIAAEIAREEGGHPHATVLGHTWRTSMIQAALVNGTTSHALDYDDVNLTVPGHMSAAIIPALFALAEHRQASAAGFIAALVAGHEFACSVGKLVEPAHYANGFHATATIGALGASVACAHLLGLSQVQACHALGVAATQAAGLKVMFGSMAKPLHAGLAAQAGLRAALLAQKGFISRTDVLECEQGFASVHGSDFHQREALSTPANGFHIRNLLFKFHAACYSTHSTIEAVAALRQRHAIDVDAVKQIDVVAGEGCSICNIQSPKTGLEAKFSLRACAAFALLGIDTSDLEAWNRVTEAAVSGVLDRVKVELVPGMTLSDSVVTIRSKDGDEWTLAYDCGMPIADKAAQSARLFAKFRALATPALGAQRTAQLLAALDGFLPDGRVAQLAEHCRIRCD